jgi:threonyl-tRNA synthetase
MHQETNAAIGAEGPKSSRLQTLRHSTAHVMATAVTRLFPEAKVTLGPTSAAGFYHDFDVSRPFTDEDLAAIEGEMQTLAAANVALGELGAFKLHAVAGAGLQRIHGVAFTTKKELDEHLQRLEDAKRRDHRKLGQELDLFSIVDGQWLWHPKGARLRYLAEQVWHDEHAKHGYELVGSPRLTPPAPSCPFHVAICRHGHRDLPVRFAELAAEPHDAHVFMTRAQLPAELGRALELCLQVLRTFGFDDFKLQLATRAAGCAGEPALWDEAEQALEGALQRSGLPYERAPGDGAASGPRLELELRDAIGREWPCGALQVELDGVGTNGEKPRALVLHRSLFGSIDRFVAVLVEHYAGAFPLWLAPLQARVIAATAAQASWARAVQQTLVERGLRVDADLSSEKLATKVRNAQQERIPLMLVCGDKEVAAGAVAPRTREGKQMPAMPLAEFAQWMEHEAQIPRPTNASVRA